MNRIAVRLTAMLCMAAFPVSILSQANPQPTPQTTPQAKKADPAAKEKKKTPEDPAEQQRRITAIALLTSLADEAKGFQDAKLRARVLAQTADALWDSNNEQSVTLFHRAWGEAETADREAFQKSLDDAKHQTEGQPRVRRSRLNMRGEVLRLAAKRDRKLGEEFLKLMTESQKQMESQATNATNAVAKGTNPGETPEADSQRLTLASQLLRNGDVDKALQFADPALIHVNTDSMFFLSTLYDKNVDAANQRFSNLVSIVAQDPTSDANTVSGLSSYAFTPFLYVTFAKDGGNFTAQSRGGTTQAPSLPPQLRDGFMRVAAQILLRPLPPPDQDFSSSGRLGTAMVIKRMLPLFQQYLPDSFAELSATVAALSGDNPQLNQADSNSSLTKGIVPDDQDKSTEQSMQDRLDHAKTSDEKDSIYAELAVRAVGKDYTQAKDLADKIENGDLRKQTRKFIDFQGVSASLNNGKDVSQALQIAKDGVLDHYQRAWAYTQASRVLAKDDKVRADEVLRDAMEQARHIGDAEPADNVEVNRARIFVAIASRYMEVDKTRGWEILGEVIKFSNAASGYTGEDNQIQSMIQTKQMAMMTFSTVPDFDVTGLFRNLATNDLGRAIEAAKGFTAESTRAAATIAIAISVLEKKA